MMHDKVLGVPGGVLALLLLGGAQGAYAMQAVSAGGQVGADAPVATEAAPPPPTETATPAPAPVEGDVAAEGEGDEETITVTGQRPPGSVVGSIPPEVTLSPADIRSYGVSTVTDLLAELAAQTGSGQGRDGGQPVTLLNGKRISGPGELRDIPTEAILRVDILPEEVALKYGYNADQKVVNFVLRPRFNAVTGELSGGTSTQGGGESGRIQSSLLKITTAGRLNLSVDYSKQGSLLESDRDIVPAASGQLFDRVGNVGPAAGLTEIDPALSALVGSTVTVAGVPAGVTGRPRLGQFAGTAGTANVTDVGRYRTLRAASDTLALNAVLNRTIFGDVSATINANYGATGSDGLRGLAGSRLNLPAGNPYSPFGQTVSVYRYPDGDTVLGQNNRGETAHAGFTLNKTIDSWNLTATGNYDRAVSRTRSDTGLDGSAAQALLDSGSLTLNPFGALPGDLYTLRTADRARSVSNSGDVELVASGSPLRLPAGPISTTFKVGGELNAFDTRSVRSGLVQSANLNRSNANAQGNIDIPLTSRRADVLGAIGDVSANVNASVDRLSDFGTLTKLGYGLNWRPTGRLSLIASQTREEGAPTVQQLGNPQISTFDVRVFDYRTGQTVGVTQISGGNPDLLSDNRRVLKLGANWKPFAKPDLSLVANYVSTRIKNASSALPAPTAAIEAAFPDRFIRNADGVLLSIDSRPVNFQRQNREQLRWGFNLSVPLKANNQALFEAYRADRDARIARGEAVPARGPGGRPEGAVGTAADRPAGGGRPDGARGEGGGGRRAGGGGGFGGGGRGGGSGRGGGGGRVQFAVYHTWQFRNDVVIRDGVPVLDLLDGAASGTGGGAPRHQVEVQAGVFRNGYGARLSGDWQSKTFVRAGGTAAGAGDGDLFFSSLATVDLRLFADFSQIPALVPYRFARGMRVSFSVNNLFNQRQGVRDVAGVTPLGYQPGYLDPIGREVRLSVRKLFF
ncbi:TonB-dependent receptor [Sphingomonas prati]|uniref:Putative membrane protein YgcG n=1 Tax=Sphingomonas prati TaxID=1843237 RepID=A0A7W9BV18_9SPHN|nr:TonB-dependent receptor [Sphingomonas prati]MBB5730208.1 putative membrane protein YgcG [Sphingomonas prati]